MRIGILGATGPAGSGLAARLASIGYEVVIGSRSKYRAMEARDSLVERVARARRAAAVRRQHGRRRLRPRRHRHAVGLGGDDGAGARDRARAARSSSAWPTRSVRVGHEFQPLVPPRGSVAAHVQAAVPGLPCGRRVPPPAGQGARPPRRADRLRRADLRRRPGRRRVVSEIVAKIPGCRPLDAGELSNATAIEAFTAVLLQLNVRYKTRVAPKLTGIKHDPRSAVAA